MKICGLIIFFLLAASAAFAGEFSIVSDSTVIGQNYGYPSGTPEKPETAPGGLDIALETAVFYKNLEIPDGRTFLGHVTPMRLRYRPHEDITLEAGIQASHYFGEGPWEGPDWPAHRDLSDALGAEPLLRIVYEPAGSVYIAAGSIIRTHAAHDALFDDAKAFIFTPEEGLQVRVDRGHVKEDIWINWKSRETPERPEKFDFGNVTQLRLGGLRLDGQVFWVHTGGQLNNPDDPAAHVVDHNISFMAGGSYGLTPGWRIEEIRLGGYYFYDKDMPDNESPLDDTTGGGAEGRLSVGLKASDSIKAHVFGAYFAGDGFLAREGDPLYGRDEYTQFGANLLFGLPAGLRIEFGAVAQYLDGSLEHTELLNFLWGRAFGLSGNMK